MNKEVDFIIKENIGQLNVWIQNTLKKNVQIVGSKEQLFNYLSKISESGDEISCSIFGAWLDVCIYRSIRDLLSPQLDLLLPGRKVISVSVDLTRSLAFDERISDPLTPIQRQQKLSQQLGDDLDTDPRLHLLT
jgi:hypothetical protein